MSVAIAVVISAFVSLTLTPMMCARFLGRHEEHEGRFYVALERFFDWSVREYARLLQIVLRHQRITLLSLFGTIAITVLLFVAIPKGFFPQQDTGLIQVSTEGSLDISFAEMKRKQEESNRLVLADPAVVSAVSFAGSGGVNTANTGRIFAALTPMSDRPGVTADDIINRLRPKLSQVTGFKSFMQSAQDINVGARGARTQYQYTLQDPDINELSHWAKVMFDNMKNIPQLVDVATDQQDSASRTMVKIDRDIASRLGISGTSDRRYALRCIRPASGCDHVHSIEPISCRAGGRSEIPAGSASLQQIYVKSASGAQVPLSAFTSFEPSTSALSVNHQDNSRR